MAKTINTILSLKDKMSGPLTKISSNVGKTTKEMKKSQNQINKWKNNSVKAIDKVVKRAGQLAALGTVAALTIGVVGLKELDSASLKVKSIAKSSLEIKQIQDGILEVSNKTGKSYEELGDTQYSAISAGIAAKDSLDATLQASKLATAGFTDSNNAISVMASTMNVFGMEGKSAMEEISDKLLVTQNLGVTTVGELASSLGAVTPIAKSVGLSLDDVLTATATLTKGGLNTSETMTGLKAMMTNIIKPSSQAQKEAKRLGIEFSSSAIQAKGFGKWLEELKNKTGGNSETLGKLFGSANALNAAISLTGDSFEEFGTIMGEMQNSVGATNDAYATMTDSLEFKLNRLKQVSKNTFTKIMQSQSGELGKGIDSITDWVDKNETTIKKFVTGVGKALSKIVSIGKSVFNFIKDNQTLIKTIGIFIGTFYGAIKVATIFSKVLTILKTVSLLFSGAIALTPLGWFVIGLTAITTAGYLLYKNWETVSNFLKSNFPILYEQFSGFIGNIKAIFTNVIDFIKNVFTGNWSEAWENVVNIFKGIFDNLAIVLKLPLNAVIEMINKAIGGMNKLKIPDWVPGIGGKGINIPLIPQLAKGTSSWRGGIVQVHERGGEIMDLPGGTRVYPHDKSVAMARKQGQQDRFQEADDGKIVIIVQGNVIGNYEFLNEMGNEIVRRLKLAKLNS